MFEAGHGPAQPGQSASGLAGYQKFEPHPHKSGSLLDAGVFLGIGKKFVVDGDPVKAQKAEIGIKKDALFVSAAPKKKE